jgi:hypothetical protein
MQDQLYVDSTATVERAVKWLDRFLSDRSSDLNQRELCLGLLGLCCGNRFLGTHSSSRNLSDASHRLIAVLLEKWANCQNESNREFASDPATRLLSAVFAASDNVLASTYQTTVLGQLRMIKELVAVRSSPQLTLTCNLLAALLDGSRQLPDLSSLSNSMPRHPFSHYLADAAEIQETLATLAILTAYGSLAPKLTESEVEFARKALPFWTFYYIKERDLDNVCPLVRTMKYLRLEGQPEYVEGLRYVLRQAREDGSFATSDLSCKCLSRFSAESLDVERTINLPLTVAAVWTLLECFNEGGSPLRCALGSQKAVGAN